jgi:hypothetical protein
MGTNYYVKDEPCCPTCGRASDVYHIGKSSMGWKFLFRGYEEQGLTSASKWFEYLASRNIVDEYGTEWSLHGFILLVNSKMDGRVHYDSKKKIDDQGNYLAAYFFGRAVPHNQGLLLRRMRAGLQKRPLASA